jgi:hypothetical protein
MPAAMSVSVQSIKSSAGNTTTQRRPSWLSEVQQSSADVSRCSSPLARHVLTTPSATVLCPIKVNEITMVEPPKVSHKNPNQTKSMQSRRERDECTSKSPSLPSGADKKRIGRCTFGVASWVAPAWSTVAAARGLQNPIRTSTW